MCREVNVTPHVVQNRNLGSAIGGRTARNVGFEVVQRKRIGPMRRVLVRGLDKTPQLLTLTSRGCGP